MKKAILALAVVALVSTTAISKTNPSEASSSKLTLSSVEDAKLYLNMSTEEKGTVKLKITDEVGNLLVAQNVAFKKSFSLPIDMSSLEEGNYTIKVEANDEMLEQNVFISQLHQEDVAAFLKEKESRKFELKVFHENTPVTIKIVDESGNTYYSNRVKNQSNFTQVFDLSEIDASTPLEIIVSGKKSRIIKTI